MGVNNFLRHFLFCVLYFSLLSSPYYCVKYFLLTSYYNIYFWFVKCFLIFTCDYAPQLFLNSILFNPLRISVQQSCPETPHFIGAIRLSEKTSFSSSIYYSFAQSDAETTWTSYIVFSFPYLSIVICFLSILKTVPMSSINSPSPALCFELLSCKSFPAMLLK